jgi:orotidine-5'-phosphate decarboxylase
MSSKNTLPVEKAGFIGKLERAWQDNNSLVCVGLDPEPARCPAALRADSVPPDADAIFSFCRAIVDATVPKARSNA